MALPVQCVHTSLKDHAPSVLVSFGKTRPIRQSAGWGEMPNKEQVSGEWGRMKSNLAQRDCPAGTLITPAHSLCFRYDTKSWNCTKLWELVTRLHSLKYTNTRAGVSKMYFIDHKIKGYNRIVKNIGGDKGLMFPVQNLHIKKLFVFSIFKSFAKKGLV